MFNQARVQPNKSRAVLRCHTKPDDDEEEEEKEVPCTENNNSP